MKLGPIGAGPVFGNAFPFLPEGGRSRCPRRPVSRDCPARSMRASGGRPADPRSARRAIIRPATSYTSTFNAALFRHVVSNRRRGIERVGDVLVEREGKSRRRDRIRFEERADSVRVGYPHLIAIRHTRFHGAVDEAEREAVARNRGAIVSHIEPVAPATRASARESSNTAFSSICESRHVTLIPPSSNSASKLMSSVATSGPGRSDLPRVDVPIPPSSIPPREERIARAVGREAQIGLIVLADRGGRAVISPEIVARRIDLAHEYIAVQLILRDPTPIRRGAGSCGLCRISRRRFRRCPTRHRACSARPVRRSRSRRPSGRGSRRRTRSKRWRCPFPRDCKPSDRAETDDIPTAPHLAEQFVGGAREDAIVRAHPDAVQYPGSRHDALRPGRPVVVQAQAIAVRGADHVNVRFRSAVDAVQVARCVVR